MQPNLSFSLNRPLCPPATANRPILPAPPPLKLHPAHRAAKPTHQASSVAQRIRQARNASAPYTVPMRRISESFVACPSLVSEPDIARALSLLENGRGLEHIPETHRTHTVAGAFMALTGASLSEVEQQSSRIGRALSSRGLRDSQIAALMIDSVKQCHYRLAHRTMTMTQLATNVINCGTRKMLGDIYAAAPSRPFATVRSAEGGLSAAASQGAPHTTIQWAGRPATSAATLTTTSPATAPTSESSTLAHDQR